MVSPKFSLAFPLPFLSELSHQGYHKIFGGSILVMILSPLILKNKNILLKKRLVQICELLKSEKSSISEDSVQRSACTGCSKGPFSPEPHFSNKETDP